MPWNKVKNEHKPVDDSEDKELLDPVLQPTRTQPVKLVARNSLPTDKIPVTNQHSVK